MDNEGGSGGFYPGSSDPAMQEVTERARLLLEPYGGVAVWCHTGKAPKSIISTRKLEPAEIMLMIASMELAAEQLREGFLRSIGQDPKDPALATLYEEAKREIRDALVHDVHCVTRKIPEGERP